jgi:putative ABC transport system permease protein
MVEVNNQMHAPGRKQRADRAGGNREQQRLGDELSRQSNIVGIVGDVRDNGLDRDPRPTVYTNYFQRPGSTSEFSIVVRGHGRSLALIEGMRREARAVNPEMPMKFETLEQIVSSSLDSRRFSMVMLGVFAGAALILAMVGLYGIMAYVAAERTTEVGRHWARNARTSCG